MNRKVTIASLSGALILMMTAGTSALALSDPQPQPQPSPAPYMYSVAGRSYLGINVQDVNKDRVSALKLKEERGVEITMVDQDAPASKAGLKEHDVILDFNGTRVESEEQFRRMVREIPPGRTVALGISRDGSPLTVQVQLGDRAKMEMGSLRTLNDEHLRLMLPEVTEMPDFNIDVFVPAYTSSLGIQGDTLGQQLGEYFGVKGGGGVLVKSVEKGSVAEKAGMKAGDVITKIENEKIADRSDLRRVLHSHREGGKISLGIVRDKHEQNIVVDLPATSRPRKSSQLEWDWPGTFDEMNSWQSWQPAVESIRDSVRKMTPQIRQAQLMAVREITPEIRNALKTVQTKMQKLRFNFDQDFI